MACVSVTLMLVCVLCVYPSGHTCGVCCLQYTWSCVAFPHSPSAGWRRGSRRRARFPPGPPQCGCWRRTVCAGALLAPAVHCWARVVRWCCCWCAFDQPCPLAPPHHRWALPNSCSGRSRGCAAAVAATYMDIYIYVYVWMNMWMCSLHPTTPAANYCTAIVCTRIVGGRIGGGQPGGTSALWAVLEFQSSAATLLSHPLCRLEKFVKMGPICGKGGEGGEAFPLHLKQRGRELSPTGIDVFGDTPLLAFVVAVVIVGIVRLCCWRRELVAPGGWMGLAGCVLHSPPSFFVKQKTKKRAKCGLIEVRIIQHPLRQNKSTTGHSAGVHPLTHSLICLLAFAIIGAAIGRTHIICVPGACPPSYWHSCLFHLVLCQNTSALPSPPSQQQHMLIKQSAMGIKSMCGREKATQQPTLFPLP